MRPRSQKACRAECSCPALGISEAVDPPAFFGLGTEGSALRAVPPVPPESLRGAAPPLPSRTVRQTGESGASTYP
eukprot:3350947-Alexandrium_andersonii.AAC.1